MMVANRDLEKAEWLDSNQQPSALTTWPCVRVYYTLLTLHHGVVIFGLNWWGCLYCFSLDCLSVNFPWSQCMQCKK